MKNENNKILINFKLPKKDNEICGPYKDQKLFIKN